MAQHYKDVWSGIGYVNSRPEEPAGIVQQIAAQINAHNALAIMASLLLSQAALPGGAMPFCVPLVAALLLLQKPAWPAMVGCALGLLVRWAPIDWVNGWQLISCLLLALVVRRGWDWKPWKVSLAAGAVMVFPLPFVTRRVDLIIVCVTGAVAAGLLTPVYLRSLLAIFAPKKTLTNDDKLCCLLVATALALGGMWLRIDMVSLGDAMIGLIVFLVAWGAGPGLALPAGAMVGLVLMTTGKSFDMVVMLAVLGGLAGMLRGSRRFMPFLGGLLGCGLIAFAQGGVTRIIDTVPSLALGGLLFLLMPIRWLDTMRGVLEPEAYLAHEPDTVVSSFVLSSYAEAMAGMATALPSPDQASDTQPVELLACRLCTGCEQQQSCWDEKRGETMALMDGVLLACSGNANAVEIEQAARMIGCSRATEVFGLASGLISSRLRKEKDDARRMEARAWALEQLRGQARALQGLSERLGEGSAESVRARAMICAAMPALRGRSDALTVCVMEGRLHVWLDVRCTEGQADRLAVALSAALGRKMELMETQTKHELLLFVERPKLRLAVGRATTPIAGEEISGDSTLSERLDAGRHVLAISDGMGSGREARSESRAALDLLLQALRAGYSRSDALRTVNGLLVACRGDEMFATLDLCIMDLNSGEATLDKLGACPSFLLRAGKCKRIGGDALPMGILDAVKPRALSTRMLPDDLLLMVSDGVIDAFGSDEAAFVRALGGLTTGDRMPTPQRFADTLLRRAYERSGGTALDDMTVVVAKVEEA